MCVFVYVLYIYKYIYSYKYKKLAKGETNEKNHLLMQLSNGSLDFFFFNLL